MGQDIGGACGQLAIEKKRQSKDSIDIEDLGNLASGMRKRVPSVKIKRRKEKKGSSTSASLSDKTTQRPMIHWIALSVAVFALICFYMYL